jgi:hypothetical protein
MLVTQNLLVVIYCNIMDNIWQYLKQKYVIYFGLEIE